MRALHRLLIASLLRPLTYDKRRTLDGRKKLRPLMVVWDEFPADGHIPAFETYAANLRGFDVWLVLAAQDQEQIDRVYGPRNAIAINCRLRLFSASLSEPSLRREQELAGTAVTTRHGRSRAGGLLGPVTRSETETTSPVVTKGELLAARRGLRARVRAAHAPAREGAEAPLLRAPDVQGPLRRRRGRAAARPAREGAPAPGVRLGRRASPGSSTSTATSGRRSPAAAEEDETPREAALRLLRAWRRRRRP